MRGKTSTFFTNDLINLETNFEININNHKLSLLIRIE